MLVLDASALVEHLLDSDTGRQVGALLDGGGGVHLPHLADAEVVSVLRSLVLRGEVTVARAAAALEDLRDVRAVRHEAVPFLGRVWELRANVTTYDALYVALAEALDAPLVTCDRRLAAAPGLRCRTELV